VGVVLYEMATGRLPFAGATSALIFDAILHKTPEPPQRANPTVPAELDQTIQRLLEKKRELRLQSAADLKAALGRIKRQVDSGTEATHATGGVPSQATPLRRAWPVVALLVAVLAITYAFRSSLKPRSASAPINAKLTQLTTAEGLHEF